MCFTMYGETHRNCHGCFRKEGTWTVEKTLLLFFHKYVCVKKPKKKSPFPAALKKKKVGWNAPIQILIRDQRETRKAANCIILITLFRTAYSVSHCNTTNGSRQKIHHSVIPLLLIRLGWVLLLCCERYHHNLQSIPHLNPMFIVCASPLVVHSAMGRASLSLRPSRP